MSTEKRTVDDAATAVLATIERVSAGQPEGALAKVLIVALSFVAGTPWLAGAEPLLQRLFEKINNKAGKDAVAEVAKQVETEEGLRRVASEVVVPQVQAVLQELFVQQRARQGIDMGNMLETIRGSADDAVARVALLMHRMEERGNLLTQSREPLVVHRILTGPTTSMRATCRGDGRSFDEVRAAQYGVGNLRLVLEVTNMSKVDVRVRDLYVDVLEYADVDVEDVWRWLGLMRTVLKYEVTLEPKIGRYACVPMNNEPNEDEYLVIPSGCVEVFSVLLKVPPREGLYVVRPAIQCSSAGENFVQEFERTATFAVYDPALRTPVRDERLRDGPPPDDGGDNCVTQSNATAMAIMMRAQAARAAESSSMATKPQPT